MKAITLTLATILTSIAVYASAEFSAFTNFWFTAQHSNALAMAERRLAANTNDIAGVLMKASWDFEFLEPSDISNALARVVQVGSTCHLPTFTNVFETTKIDARFLLDIFPLEPPEERIADRAKRGLPGKLPHYIRELKALDDDGYFVNCPPL